MSSAPVYSIGSDTKPGLSKLLEEAGEVVQVIGKIIGIGGAVKHWDGTDLQARLADEIADLRAAIDYVAYYNGINFEAIWGKKREEELRALHQEADGNQPYLLGADHLPGALLVAEQCGNLITATHSFASGYPARDRFIDQLMLTKAVLRYFTETNNMPLREIEARRREKLATFRRWHDEAHGQPAHSSEAPAG